MANSKDERRKFGRYDTDVRVYYRVEFDFETKVDYRRENIADKEKHHAISRNVSAEGIAFTSHEQLKVNDRLQLDVFLPGDNDPIPMTGEVRWSREENTAQSQDYKFLTGVKMLTVAGQSVKETIYFDDAHKVYWSVVLESILGKFKTIGLKRKEKKGN